MTVLEKNVKIHSQSLIKESFLSQNNKSKSRLTLEKKAHLADNYM